MAEQISTEVKLCRLFRDVWLAQLDGFGLDALALECLLRNSGLVEDRACTEAEASAYSCGEVEAGDTLVCLNEEGRACVALARQ